MMTQCKPVVFLLAIVFSVPAHAESWSQKMAGTVMSLWTDSAEKANGRQARWSYEQGVVLEGMEAVWYRTADARYFNYIQKRVDQFVDDDGTIRNYKQEDYNIDQIGRAHV